jgi:anhydro-N-acetylmuramic acid kinase
MSGTSLDGISGAVVRFRRRPPADDGPPFAGELLATDTRPYSESQRARLERALAEPMSAVEWCRLDADLGSWLADAAVAVIAQAGVARAEIEAIGSHGQTVWHEPGHSTWQIGEAAVIAERTGRPVVSDLRARDVAAGGQGAPLVSIADALLFSRAGAWRALQNLGGIGNVTVVPPAAARATATAASDAAAVPSLEGVRAFDTGPGVVVIDAVVRALRPGARYDEDGALARAGHVIPGVVPALLAAPYFAAMPPKSTGREQFSASYVADFMARCREARPDASDADLVATAVALTAGSIADAVRRFVLEPIGDLLLSGGGARNPALVDAITASLAPLAVRRFDREFFDGEAKEAVAFALLAYLHVRGLPGNVPSATGARGPRVLGVWTPA